MKTLSFLRLFVAILVLQIPLSCRQNNEQLIPTVTESSFLDSFLSSMDFKKLNVSALGEVDLSKSKITYFNDDKMKPIINIVFSKEGNVTAIIEAIKNPNKHITLPNNGDYYMLLRDLRDFDLSMKTGSIKLSDLNYDNHVFNSIEFVNSIAQQSSYYDMPLTIKSKYKEIGLRNLDYINSQLKNARVNVPCDSNKDGNLGFSECYACYNRACGGNDTCYTLCYGIGDVAGWLITGVPHCQVSIGAACVYLSAVY